MTEHLRSVKGRRARAVLLLPHMLALPHVSGSECIDVMTRLGFRTQRRAGGLVTMRRGIDAVIVPETATLAPALLNAILRAAGVLPLEFLQALDAPAPRSFVPPAPDSTSAVA